MESLLAAKFIVVLILLNPIMTYPFNKVLILAFVCSSLTCQSQQIIARISPNDNDPFDKKLSEKFLVTKFDQKEVPTLDLPKRKHSSMTFVNEFIPFGEGYIINSLTTSPGGGKIDIDYSFYFLNLTNNHVSKIEISGIDTIHSIINEKGAIFVSGKKGNELKVLHYTENGMKELPFTGDILNKVQQPKNWLKLGIYKSQLLALCRDGIIQYTDAKWTYLPGNSIDDYFLQLGYKRSRAIIPTENIRFYGDKMYFLQEIVQQRSAELFSLDMGKPNSIKEFFVKNNLTDNTKKEIDAYLGSTDGNLYIAITRLMENQILLRENSDGVNTVILNGQLKEKINEFPINISSMTEFDDKKIMIGNGLFEMKENVLTPILFFDNMKQQIKDGGYIFNDEFRPRAIAMLGSSKYLLGGLFGGIYILDVAEMKIKCLDDLKDQPKTRKLF
ncbi:MAG: hypothetical protein V4717_18655 [Bacteroidota bacterium]